MSNPLEPAYYALRYWSIRHLFSIPTHLTHEERVVLYRLGFKLAKKGRRSIAVEVGSYLGASSAFLASGLKQTGQDGKVICIDTWENDAMSEGGRDTMAEFLANTAALTEWIQPIRGWSTAVVDKVREHAGEIDLLFIDGDHSYEGCLADWRAYNPLLASNAIVVMHDVGWAEGVTKVIDEEIRPATINEQRLPNMWWGQLGR